MFVRAPAWPSCSRAGPRKTSGEFSASASATAANSHCVGAARECLPPASSVVCVSQPIFVVDTNIDHARCAHCNCIANPSSSGAKIKKGDGDGCDVFFSQNAGFCGRQPYACCARQEVYGECNRRYAHLCKFAGQLPGFVAHIIVLQPTDAHAHAGRQTSYMQQCFSVKIDARTMHECKILT